MDKRFNGLRYSTARECLIDQSGEEIHMRNNSTQVFLFLKQNLNELVTKEQLLNKVPTNNICNSDSRPKLARHSAGTSAENPNANPNDALNDCIAEITHVVGEGRLKTIPPVGYLLTSDAADASENRPNFSSVATRTGKHAKPTLVQELVFNSQWVVCMYQKSPSAWIGTFVLLTAFLFSPTGSSIDKTMGHIAYDRAESNACSSQLTDCFACVPNFWRTSSVFAHSNWFSPKVCK